MVVAFNKITEAFLDVNDPLNVGDIQNDIRDRVCISFPEYSLFDFISHALRKYQEYMHFFLASLK